MKKNIFKIISETISVAYDIEKYSVMLMFIESFINSLTPYFAIYLSARILNGLSAGEGFNQLFLIVILGVAIIFIWEILINHINKLLTIHRRIAFHNIDMKHSEIALQMNYSQLDSPKTNEIRNRIQSDNIWGSGFFSIYWMLPGLLNQIFSILIALTMLIPMFFTYDIIKNHILLILLIIMLVINILLVVININYFEKKNIAVQNEANTNKNYLFYFIWGGVDYKQGKDIRIYNTSELIKAYMDKGLNWWHSWTKRISRLRGVSQFINIMIAMIIEGGIYIVLIIYAVSSSMTIGDIMKYTAILISFMAGLSGVAGSMMQFVNYAKHQQSRLEFFNIPNKMYQGTLPVEKRKDNEYEIEFKDVSFKYPDTDNYVLKNISFKFKIGQRLAVVGMNGSGKTTMIKLLCRLYDPTDGEITLNGIDIRKYRYNEYLKIFSVVFQDFKLFSFSLGQNVAVSNEIDNEWAMKCLLMAGFNERIENMSDGLDTPLYKDFEESGVEISGGEAQKVAIARALYKDAPFIILDEPTAALDPISEFEIYSKFNEIVGDKTAIYISHRLSSCRFCDDIAVFHEGELIQRGSHDTLIADENGKYHELWNAQAQYYNE